ncbi:MAG: hypothetical protein GY776_07135, partial [Alteromonas sp.]|nr:hypothetical protein [Alteromonas sp.]
MPVKDEELLFIDADTLLDEKGGRHRLLGADTNETVHPTKPETIQGHIQKAAMMEFAQGAHLEPSGIDDIYGRNLSNLKRDDGTNVMEQFVEAGMVPASYGSSKEMQAASTRAIYREALGVSNPQLEGFRQLSEYYKKKNPLKPIIKDTFRSDGSFKRSMRRGADNMQASLYSFTNVMGQLFGSDTVKEWSDKGIERNLEEAMVNPPKIENYQHVKSFDALGTYIVETFGEQIPNLLTMIGSGGAALLGKAAAQQLGKGALARVAANTSRSNAILAGTAGVNFPQLTGEANNELRKHGIEAPGTALAAGLTGTVLETYGLSKLLEKYLNAYKASGKGMGDLLKSVGVATGSQFAVEGATEMSQTFTNKLAVAAHKDDYDILSDDNLVEMIDAGLRGGLVGAGMGGSASFAGGVANRLKPEGTDPKTPNDGGPDGFSLEQQPWEQQSLVGPEPQNLDQEESFDNPNQMGFDLEDPNAPKQEWYRGYIDPTKEFNANSMTSGRLDNSGQTPEITGVDFSQYSTDSLMNAFNAEQPDYNTLGPYEAEAYDVNYEALTAELERRDAFNEFEYYENDSNISPSVVPTFPEPGPTLSADVKGEVDPAEGEPAETMDSILGVPADYLFPDQVEAMPPTLNHKEGKDGTRSVEVKDEKEQDSIVNHEVITVVLPTFPESGPTLSADHLNEVITVVLPTSPEPGPTLSADVKDEKEQDSIPTQPVYNTVGQTDKITDKTTNDAFKNNKAITPELSKRIVEGLRKFVSDMEAENDTTPPRREDYESKEAFRRDFKAHRLDTQLYRTVKNILKNTKKGLVSALMGSSKKGDIAALLRKINEDPTTNSYGFNESFEELKDSQLDFGQTDMFPQKHEETKNTKKGGKKKTDHKGTLSVNRKPGRKPRAFDPTSISPSGQDKNLVGKSEERDVNELLGIAKNIAEERGRKVEEANVPKRSSTRSPFDADDIVNSDAPVFENIDDDAITDSQDDDTRDFRTSATREESDVYLGRQMVKYESLNKLSKEEKAKLDTSESEDKMGRLRRHKLNHGEIGSLSNKDAKVKGFANREAAEKFAKEQIREGKNYPEYADLKDDPDAIRVIKKKGRYFIKISPRPEMFSSGTKISAFDVRMDDNDLFRVAIKKAHNSYKSLKQAIKTLNKSQTRDDISPGYSGRGLLKTKVGYIQLPYLVSLMRSYKQTTTKENMSERDKQKEDVTNTLSALWATDILPAKEKAKIFSHQSKDGLTPYGRSLQVGFHKGKVRTMGDYTGQGRMNHVERNMSLSKGERAELAAGKKPREGYVRGIDEDILSANEAKLLKATNKIAANPGGELSVDEVSLAIYKAIESYLRGTGRLENVNQHTDISKLPFRDDGQSSETIGQRIKRAFKYVENRGFDSDALKKVKDIYEGPNLRLIENLTEKDMARLHRSLVEDEVGAYLQEEILPLSTEVGLPHKAKQKGIADREMEALQTRKRNALRTKAGAKIKKARDRIEDTETVDPSTKETVSEEEMEAIKRSNGDSQTVYDLTRKSDKIQTDRERLEEAEERAAKTEAHRVEDEGNLKRIMKGITGRQNLTISDKGFSPR